MKKINISKRDQKLLIILGGLIICLLAYFFVYQAYMEKATSLNTQISERRTRLEELREYESDLPTYEAGIEDISAECNAELGKYPNDVRSEDMVMYGATLENDLGVSVDDMSFGTPEYVSEFNVPVKAEDGSNALEYITAMRTSMQVSCGMNYTQFKELINYIYDTTARTTLDSISVSYNAESGGLSGSAQLSKFFVTRDPYEYKETVIPKVDLGVTDPFGTVGGSSSGSSAEADAEGSGTSSGSSGGAQ